MEQVASSDDEFLGHGGVPGEISYASTKYTDVRQNFSVNRFICKTCFFFFVATTQLCHPKEKATTDDEKAEQRDCVAIKLYLQKRVCWAGLSSVNCSLPTLERGLKNN